MLEDLRLVRWAGTQVVVALQEHMDESNAGQIQDELLSVINGGANALTADMTATISLWTWIAGAAAPVMPRASGAVIIRAG